MSSLHLLSEAFRRHGTYRPEPYPETPVLGLCCVTGDACETIARKHLLGPSFTDLELLVLPDSDRIGVHVWDAFTAGELRDGKARRYCPERMSSWRCTADQFEPLTRQGVRDAVFGATPNTPWAGYATTSYKKHGGLRAPVNTGSSNVWLWESVRVDCSDREALQGMWDALRRYQDAGIPRPVLETGDLEPHLVGKIGVDVALEYQRWATPRIESALYQFCVYLLPSADELEQINATTRPAAPVRRGETASLL